MNIKTLNKESSFGFKKDLNYDFAEACKLGNVNIVAEIYNKYYPNSLTKNIFHSFLKIVGLNSPKLDIPYSYESPLLLACENNHFNVVEFLLNKHFMKQPDSIQKRSLLNHCLGTAISNDNLELVKLILPFVNSKDKQFYSDISGGFVKSCHKGNINMINFILTNEIINPPNLKQNKGNDSEIQENNDQILGILDLKNKGFVAACDYSNFKVIKYFTESPGLINHININNFLENYPSSLVIEDFKLMEYFIFDLNLDENLFYGGKIEFDSPLDVEQSEESIEKIVSLFEKRELFNQINSDLDVKNKNVNKRLKL
jgi:hypothetical protein